MIIEILNIIVPVFIVAAIGYWLERGTGPFHTDTMSRVAMVIGTPCLVFTSLTNTILPDDSLVRIVGLAIAAVLIGGAISIVYLLILRQPLRTFLSPLCLPNAGNAGLPLVYFAFGDPGLTIGAAFFFMIAIIQYTVVPAIVTGDPGLRKLVRQPLVWSVAAVLMFRITDLPIPTIVADTTELLGGIMIPLMLILLGGALARLKISDIRMSVILGASRLAIGVVSGYSVVTIFGLTGVEAGAIFLLASMPSALVTYVITEHYSDDGERVAGVVVSSTIIVFASLPILISFAIGLAGTGG